jgi:uncharacterized protein (DUF305 family)
MLACVVVALALVASGCSSDAPESGRVALGLATDKAYLTILSAENDTAVAYSQAILKTDPSAEVTSIAKNAISLREQEAKKITKLEANDSDDSEFTLPDAAEQLNTSLSELGLSATGTPLAAPSTEAGYIKAMTANGKAVLKATEPEADHGSPGVVPFAKQVALDRTDELQSLHDFQ